MNEFLKWALPTAFWVAGWAFLFSIADVSPSLICFSTSAILFRLNKKQNETNR